MATGLPAHSLPVDEKGFEPRARQRVPGRISAPPEMVSGTIEMCSEPQAGTTLDLLFASVS
jgi:hypothetical protein